MQNLIRHLALSVLHKENLEKWKQRQQQQGTVGSASMGVSVSGSSSQNVSAYTTITTAAAASHEYVTFINIAKESGSYTALLTSIP